MALLFTVLLSVSGAILGYLLLDFGRRDFFRAQEATLDAEMKALASFANDPAERLLSLQKLLQLDPLLRFRYEDQTGIVLSDSSQALPVDIRSLMAGVLYLELDTSQGRQVFATKLQRFADGSSMVLARNVHELASNYQGLKQLSWLIFFLLLAVVLVSFGISYFVVSRINRIAGIAQNIVETGDLSQRLTIDSRWDDLSNLSLVLNGFLAKIEDLMYGVREVSNQIAHDLRTPLSGLRSDIESLKGQVVDDQKIDALLADADRTLAVFQALLRITNIEKGKRSTVMQLVDLEKIVQDVAGLYEPVAEEKEIVLQLRSEGLVQMRGDSDLLFQLFANLLDNAIKFSPAGGRILISVGREKNQLVALIEDQGPGIAEAEKEKVFKHFYRGEASFKKPGNGLGLSLVRAVVDQHQAAISLENNAPGLRVRIVFQPYQ